MLKLYKDRFTLLPVKGQAEPYRLDDNWTWKRQRPGMCVSSGTQTGSRLLLLPVIAAQLGSICIFMLRIWLTRFFILAYHENNSISLTLDKMASHVTLELKEGGGQRHSQLVPIEP